MTESTPDSIVVVDDDEGKRYSIVKILKRANFEVRETSRGIDALQMVAEQKPDLVILDVKLPDISGFEVCRRLKMDPATASIAVLHVSTTFVGIEDKVQGLEIGADGYLTDVLEPLELIATVNALLRARRAEEAAQITAKQWQMTFDSVNDGVLLLDRAGKVVQANQAVEQILQRAWADITNSTLDEILAIGSSALESPFTRMLHSRNREGTELLRGNRWLKLTVDPIRAGVASVKGALCIISDNTERRRLEEELRQRAEELAAADRRKDEFLAMLAHELRNPLAPILNSLEEIHLRGAGEPAIEQAIQVAGRQVRHMSRLLEDLLDVSRITRGKVQLRKVPVAISTVVAHALETTRPTIEANRHHLTVTQPNDSIWIEGDITRLEQILANLLHNASKYSEPGGQIHLSVALEDKEVVLRVQDQGIGLSAEMLPRVFDLFSQADMSLDRAQGGIGIGLTLVRSLVEMHGGTVTAHSEGLGRGSLFVVRLPVPTTATILPPELPKISPHQSTSKTLLLVDDHRDSALSLARVLRLWGHQVNVAHDGSTAVEEAVAQRYEIILLDIGLPGMDGFEVARHLSNDPRAGRPFLVALTGYGQDEDQRRSRAAGFDVHLVKPVNLDDLRRLFDSPEVMAKTTGNPEELPNLGSRTPLADTSPN